MTCPVRLTSGPPELPGLMAASVCTKSSYMFMSKLRPLPLMMPWVTEPIRPNGAPTARTRSPISILLLSPSFRKGRLPLASRRTMARSVLGSVLMFFEVNLRPSLSCTVTSSAPSTTWLLVRTMPMGSTRTPEPKPRRRGSPRPGASANCCGRLSSKGRRKFSGRGGALRPRQRGRVALPRASMLTTAGSTCLTMAR